CSIVIFGASGDLTARKLIPALFHLYLDNQLPKPFRIIGFARREKTDAAFRAELFEGLKKFSRTKATDDEKTWNEFAKNLFYCQGDISDANAYKKLESQLAGYADDKLRRNLLFYLATAPSQFAEIAEHLHKSGLLQKDDQKFWQRIV